MAGTLRRWNMTIFAPALEWLTETGEAEWGLRLGAALFRFWETREYLAEGSDSLGKLLRLKEASAPTKARRASFFAAGVLASEQGDYAAADALLSESLEIARHLGDTQGAAVSLNAMAVNARDRNDLAVAHSLFEKSLALWRESGELKAIARALSNLATVLKLQGEYRARASASHGVSGDIRRIGRSHRRGLVAELSRGCGSRSG